SLHPLWRQMASTGAESIEMPSTGESNREMPSEGADSCEMPCTGVFHLQFHSTHTSLCTKHTHLHTHTHTHTHTLYSCRRHINLSGVGCCQGHMKLVQLGNSSYGEIYFQRPTGGAVNVATVSLPMGYPVCLCVCVCVSVCVYVCVCVFVCVFVC